MPALLTQIFHCFIALGVMLLAGTFLRALIPAFQKLFLPASVIGGFIGLILGPSVLGLLPIPRDWIAIWAALPGLLIIPVVSSAPLGMKFAEKGSAGRTSVNALKIFCAMFVVGSIQGLSGLSSLGLFRRIRPDLNLYPTFGYELNMGFAGGHGSSAVLGSFLRDLGLPYWEIAQGITVTTATFGLVGGMISGIFIINIMVRLGRTALLKKPGDIPKDKAKGVEMDLSKQTASGVETTYGSTIDSIGFHLSIIFLGCGIAYMLNNYVRANNVPVITQVPIWAYAIVVMFGLNFLIQKLGLGNLVDSKTKSKITGTFSDFAITAAIASMPLQTIMTYIAPIMFMMTLGFVFTFIGIYLFVNFFFHDYRVERIVALWGTSTGVFLTGLMLLKICDANYETPVLKDYSIGFSLTTTTGFIMLPLIINTMINQGIMATVLLQLGLGAAAIIFALILRGKKA